MSVSESTLDRINRTSRIEFTRAMEKIEIRCAGDPEAMHVEFDNLIIKLLQDLGYKCGVEIFERNKLHYA